MKVFDEEDRQKVDRHRQMRQGKGFVTIEQTVDIEKALLRMEPGARTALVECVSNLTANEMFSEHGIRQEEDVAEKIADGILKLKKAVDHLVAICLRTEGAMTKEPWLTSGQWGESMKDLPGKQSGWWKWWSGFRLP